MTLLAVSFCNRSTAAGPVLAVLDPVDGERREVSVGHEGIVSASGLAHDGEHLYCAYTDSSGSFVAVFDNAGNDLHERLRLPNVGDVHSIALDDGAIIAVSTGTDEVVRFDTSTGRTSVLWRASASAADTHHLNALVWHQGHLLCSGFGLKLGPAWSDAVDGYVYDVTAGRHLLRGLYHPHSLAGFEGELYFCESSEGTVRSRTQAIRYMRGYARGLAFAEDGTYYAGSSVARRTRSEPHLFRNPADEGNAAGRCEIAVGSLRSREQAIVPLDGLADEIYDLLVLPPRVQ